MSHVERIEALKSKHQILENELRVEVQRPLPDSGMIARLKREKLWLKDQMTALTRQ